VLRAFKSTLEEIPWDYGLDRISSRLRFIHVTL
jgi:hypothetical protein